MSCCAASTRPFYLGFCSRDWLARWLHGYLHVERLFPARIRVDLRNAVVLRCPAPNTFVSDVDAAAELTPALLVLNKLVLASEDSRGAVKRAIFPPEADEVCLCVCVCIRARDKCCFRHLPTPPCPVLTGLRIQVSKS